MKGRLARAIAIAVLVSAAAFVPSVQAASTATHSAAPKSATPIVTNGAWTVYHRDDGHTGFDSTLPAVTGASTGWVSTALDQSIYAEPLVYQGIVYAATLNNTVYALNQSDGSIVWSNHIRAPETTGWSCGNVSPQGIIGTPVIDATGGRIYVVTLDTTDDLYRLEGLGIPRLCVRRADQRRRLARTVYHPWAGRRLLGRGGSGGGRLHGQGVRDQRKRNVWRVQRQP